MNKLHVLALATLALLAAAVTSFAQLPAWTSPGSAGATIDGTSINKYAVSPFPTNACLTFKSTKTGTIIARYDVVNTAVPSTPLPLWTTFELGYNLPAPGAPSAVKATLYRVFPCTGQVVEICHVDGVVDHICDFCQFPNNSFNYLTNLYMVEVILTRPTLANPIPSVCTLRIF